MTKYYAREDIPYDGGEALFSFTFPYIKKENIHVFVNNIKIFDYEFQTKNSIRIFDELNTRDEVSIRRITPIDEKVVKFTDTSILKEEVQNLAQDQVFYAIQENTDLNEEFVSIANTVVDSLVEINQQVIKATTQADRAEDIADVISNLGDVAGAEAQKAMVQAELAQAAAASINPTSGKAGQYLQTDGQTSFWADAHQPQATVNSIPTDRLLDFSGNIITSSSCKLTYSDGTYKELEEKNLEITPSRWAQLIPTMTSNTEPFGTVVSTVNFFAGYEPYKMWGDNTLCYTTPYTTTKGDIAYNFQNELPKGEYKFSGFLSTGSESTLNLYRVELIYNDDTKTVILEDSLKTVNVLDKAIGKDVLALKPVKAINLYIDKTQTGASGCMFKKFKLIGKTPDGDIYLDEVQNILYENDELVSTTGNIYEQTKQPKNAPLNSYWLNIDPTVNGISKGKKQTASGTWIDTAFTKAGKLHLSGGEIVRIEDYPLNSNTYEAHPQGDLRTKLDAPDYSKETTLVNGALFTSPQDGWIQNGVKPYLSPIAPINKNESFTPNSTNFRFYPTKGVN